MLTVPIRACSLPVLDATQASMRSAESRTSRWDSRLLLLAPLGLGEIAAYASLGIVGIFSRARPDVTRAGAGQKPSCMHCCTIESRHEIVHQQHPIPRRYSGSCLALAASASHILELRIYSLEAQGAAPTHRSHMHGGDRRRALVSCSGR